MVRPWCEGANADGLALLFTVGQKPPKACWACSEPTSVSLHAQKKLRSQNKRAYGKTNAPMPAFQVEFRD